MPDWSLLRTTLDGVRGSVSYTWSELEAIVGALPPSASKHRAWWSGDRQHVKVWRKAGFSVTDLVLGCEVTFKRDAQGRRHEPEPTGTRETEDTMARRGDARSQADILLITCVKEKLPVPAAAEDLYVSTLFKKERAYAERSGLPWFILSAEHGLVAPTEWLAPYERYLPDTPATFRDAWGAWVIERLEMLTGALNERVIEVHASATYVNALRPRATAKGAVIVEPLQGLTLGQRLAWYGEDRARDRPLERRDTWPTHVEAAAFEARLLEDSNAVRPADFLSTAGAGLRKPGLYSWWIDATGAAELSTGLGLDVQPGLIYAGLAGATRWPSGRQSSNTLWSRIASMHLGHRHEFSTFRRSLGSVLAKAREQSIIDEESLTSWMHTHLTVLAIPYEDADTLGRLEEDVLRGLDPPLNLQGMTASPVRVRLKELRRPHNRGPNRGGR